MNCRLHFIQFRFSNFTENEWETMGALSDIGQLLSYYTAIITILLHLYMSMYMYSEQNSTQLYVKCMILSWLERRGSIGRGEKLQVTYTYTYFIKRSSFLFCIALTPSFTCTLFLICIFFSFWNLFWSFCAFSVISRHTIRES